MSLRLEDPVTAVPGVGAALARRLHENFGLRTVRDLVEHYPRRYDDAGDLTDLAGAGARAAGPATLVGEILAWDSRRVEPRGKRRRFLHLSIAEVRDRSGAQFTITFFNQRWRPQRLPPGTIVRCSGTLEQRAGRWRMSAPDIDELGHRAHGDELAAVVDRLAHRRLVPLYPATDELPSSRLAALIAAALDQLAPVEDWLPAAWLREHGLWSLDAALRGIHRPESLPEAEEARCRLAFDELLTIQLGLHWRRAHLEADTVGLDNRPLSVGWARRFLVALPFAPTAAQHRALAGIGEDLAAPVPMHRLLQGDVGSGKTLVAVWTLLCAVDHGRQAALMAPTEVLAEQHHRTLSDLLAPLGVNLPDGLRLELLTSSTTLRERRRILAELLSGQVDLIVGTHALLEEGVRFADLGVVVIDEQHRFGVSQRVRLREKATEGPLAEAALAVGSARPSLPDVLVMTATPIPRSLALTLYGDLDVTVLDELPPGRQPIRTQLIQPAEAHRRERLEAFVRREVAEGRRVYVVCPLIENSDAVPATSVLAEHRRLSTEVFPDLEVELLHGRMRPADKERAMARFRSGQAPVLVSTTVIEVGVDVPEASLMIIEDAERFGISQLHQLRGRVGRGPHASYCVLFAGFTTWPLEKRTLERLEAVAASSDGFDLAERDLAIRGTGQLFGTAQSGLPDLKLARIAQDLQLVAMTRKIARHTIAADPRLEDPAHASLRAELLRRYEGGLDAFAALQTG